MDWILPNREAAKQRGWKYQVQWIEVGNPCHVRCTSGAEADGWATKLRKQGLTPEVIDLTDALQLH